MGTKNRLLICGLQNSASVSLSQVEIRIRSDTKLCACFRLSKRANPDPAERCGSPFFKVLNFTYIYNFFSLHLCNRMRKCECAVTEQFILLKAENCWKKMRLQICSCGARLFKKFLKSFLQLQNSDFGHLKKSARPPRAAVSFGIHVLRS